MEPFESQPLSPSETNGGHTSQYPAHGIFPLSWVAYVRPVVLFLALLLLGLIISQSAREANIILAGYGLILLAIVKLIYDIAWLKRALLYFNPDGVWFTYGLLPWRKGVRGLKWRDIDTASYYTGFVSWLTKSYRLRVSHRFTRESELFVAHVKRGNEAVEAINARLMRDFSE